jgi:hypothetical protein
MPDREDRRPDSAYINVAIRIVSLSASLICRSISRDRSCHSKHIRAFIFPILEGEDASANWSLYNKGQEDA